MTPRPPAAKTAGVTLDGSTSRTLLILSVLASATLLAWHGTLDGQAYVAIVSVLLGGVVHASGTRQGSQASVDPPPDGP